MPRSQLNLLRMILRAGEQGTEVPLAQMRVGYETFLNKFPQVETFHRQPVDVGGVPGEWITTARFRRRVVLYVHGGGFVIGSVHSHRQLVARLSRAARARCLAIDYRLAPEHPFPAALDDVLAAYGWLLAENVDPARVVIAGDSAGGGLAVIAATLLRDAGEPLPAALVCISPWVDLEGLGESLDRHAHLDPLVQRDGMIKMAQLYLDGTDPRDPQVSPLHADLRGLPPILIQVGGAETLLDDALRLAARTREAGVEVELEVWPEMIHVWHHFASRLTEGQEAIDKVGAFVRRWVR